MAPHSISIKEVSQRIDEWQKNSISEHPSCVCENFRYSLQCAETRPDSIEPFQSFLFSLTKRVLDPVEIYQCTSCGQFYWYIEREDRLEWGEDIPAGRQVGDYYSYETLYKRSPDELKKLLSTYESATIDLSNA